MTRSLLISIMALVVGACGDGAGVNPPTEPAEPIETADATVPGASPASTTSGLLPGTGPASFVGRWTTNVSWCAAPTASGRPIEITTTRFEGYENSCDIAEIDQVVGGYEADLRCTSQGQVTNERARMIVNGQTLSLTWLNRGPEPVTLLKCTTLTDNSTATPALPMP